MIGLEAGLEKIKIPLKSSEVNLYTIRPYLDFILTTFRSNRTKIANDYSVYLLNQKILSKTRLHQQEVHNNKVLHPNVYSMVNWKCGYIFGNPIKYAEVSNSTSNELIKLNEFLRKSNKASIDKTVATWVYATGVGYYFIQPKILDKASADKEAPFLLTCVKSTDCCKVYSSYIGEEPLFDILYSAFTKKDEKGISQNYELIDIYTPNDFFEFETLQNGYLTTSYLNAIPTREEKRIVYKELPLVEKRLNQNCVSITDVVKSLTDSIDMLLSDELDNIQDITNVIYKYKNMLLGKTQEAAAAFHQNVKRNGVISLNTPQNAQRESDLDIVKIPPLDYGQIGDIVAQLTRTAYYSVGCPMPNSEITSGNITRGGGEITSGHDNAYNIALAETTEFLPADRELLYKILTICKQNNNTNIKNLSISDVDIKYIFNLADNVLSKSEAFSLLVKFVPPALALKYVHISSDPEADGIEIEKYMEKLASLETDNNDIEVAEPTENKFVERKDT